MRFENFDILQDIDNTPNKAKQKSRHFFSTSPHEPGTSSVFPDRGKDVLTPEEMAEEEEQLKRFPFAENGQRAPKLVNLASECTPTEPRMLGGMHHLKKLWGGGTSRESAEDLFDQANLYHNQGKYSKAESLYKRLLKICERDYGRDDPDTAGVLHNLALLYKAQGEYSKAEPLLTRALKIFEQKFGRDDPETADTLNGLGAIYFLQGEYSKAEPLLMRALKIKEQKLGRDHPDTAVVLINLGSLYCEQGEYSKAESLLMRALKIYEQKLELDHPDTAMALNNLANLYREQGEYSKAEPLLMRALKIKEQKLGSDHPSTANTLLSLANLYREQDEYSKAEPSYKRALKIFEQKFGSDHISTAEILNDLAGLCKKQGKHAEARRLYTLALKIRQEKLGPNNPKTVKVRNDLADLDKRQDQQRPQRDSSGEPSSSRPADRRTDSRRPDGEQRVERQLGDYRLKEVLGEGSFAKVYLGVHVDPTKPPAAVKVFKMPLIGPIKDQFLNEVKILEELKHEHIVRIYDSGVTDDHYPFLAMELARRGTLAQLHPIGTRVPYMQISNYLDQIGSGLDYAHAPERKIVHRDLKPANLLVVEKPNGEIVIKIGDFGMAKVFQNSSSRTTPEGIIGTFAYMSPDQIQGKSGSRSDQYTVGVMLYLWLSGHLLFEGVTPFEIMGKHIHASPEPIPGVAQEIQDVVFCALAKNPDDRFKSVTELAQEFKRAARIALCELGVQLLQSGQYTEAVKEFDRILGLDAQNTFALRSRGETYQRLNQHGKASEDFNRILGLDAQNTFALRSRGQTYQRSN
jgi:tetratricopeptide (TPR) repeat protein